MAARLTPGNAFLLHFSMILLPYNLNASFLFLFPYKLSAFLHISVRVLCILVLVMHVRFSYKIQSDLLPYTVHVYLHITSVVNAYNVC